MAIRHAAALALVGWYFMLAPIDKNNPHTIDNGAPLSIWVRIAAPDGDICHSWMITAHADGINLSTESPKTGASRMLTSSEFRKRLLTAQCVSSDDPRLKE